MKINNISPQINFKQVIQIEMSNEESYAPHRYINSNKELVSVLNNKKNSRQAEMLVGYLFYI